jgi:hypothetical protein
MVRFNAPIASFIFALGLILITVLVAKLSGDHFYTPSPYNGESYKSNDNIYVGGTHPELNDNPKTERVIASTLQ